jgi:hypothetical protein
MRYSFLGGGELASSLKIFRTARGIQNTEKQIKHVGTLYVFRCKLYLSNHATEITAQNMVN